MTIRKGMTLIEVIIAMTILSLMTVIFSQSALGQYKLLRDTRHITKDIFNAAKLADHEIQNIKAATSGAPLPSPSKYPMFAGNDKREVFYQPVQEPAADPENPAATPAVQVHSMVALEQAPEYESLVITSNNTTLVGGTVTDGAYAYSASSARVEVNATVNNPALDPMIKYQWYVSEPKFPMRWKNIDFDDPAASLTVPIYPANYTIIPNANLSSLTVTNEFAGKHLLCIMTPASRLTGKMGNQVMSDPQYIFGLPVLDSLAAHYDASIIDDPAIIHPAMSPGKNEIDKWPDTSPNRKDAGGSSKPTLSLQAFDGIMAQSVNFDGCSYLEPGAMAVSTGFTMFAVVKAEAGCGSDEMGIVSKGSSWSFDMSKYPEVSGDEWYILGLNSNGERTIGKSAGLSLGSGGPFGDKSLAGGFKIGYGGKIMVAELIIYSSAMSTGPDSDWEKITEYLGGKYNLS